MSNKGFASFSKQRRTAVSTKGGQTVQRKGTGYSFDIAAAKAAAAKSTVARRKKRARVAALELLRIGFTAGQLMKLELSEDEYLYYGGHLRNKKRVKELISRLNSLEVQVDHST